MAKSKANPKQTCLLYTPFLTSPIRRKPLIHQSTPRPTNAPSEFRFQFPRGSVGSSPIIRTNTLQEIAIGERRLVGAVWTSGMPGMRWRTQLPCSTWRSESAQVEAIVSPLPNAQWSILQCGNQLPPQVVCIRFSQPGGCISDSRSSEPVRSHQRTRATNSFTLASVLPTAWNPR